MTYPDFLYNDWHVVASSKDVQSEKPFKARLLGEDLVLWRKDDQVIAWQDRCPHRGASLARGWVEKDRLVCPYHGFAFDTEGQCAHIPSHPEMTLSTKSKACVKTYHAQERYGLVWVCLGTPVEDIPRFAEWDNPNYYKFFFGPSHYKASPLRALENFIDVNHFPFVHQGVGSPDYAQIDAYDVEMEPDGIHISDVQCWETDRRKPGEMVLYILNFHVLRPLTACLSRKDDPLVIFYTVTPVDHEECLIWRWNLFHQPIPEHEFNQFVEMIMHQDVEVVESQTPKRLPLDLQAEFHLPSDRATITYRKWLKRLGVTFGAL